MIILVELNRGGNANATTKQNVGSYDVSLQQVVGNLEICEALKL